ncbi:MAG: hypothetical protein IPO92_07155 [Saprospiraceae bacterium]|nr:hypothetical protein [Saprospiraceae bacterium]
MNFLGNQATAIGLGAMMNALIGGSNTAVGSQTLFNNVLGINNSAIGYKSLYSNTNGNNNTAVGYLALHKNTIGDRNTAIGNYALMSGTNGNDNTAIGQLALSELSSGSFNTSLGSNALENLTSGSHNTAVGASAMKNLITGSFNTALGKYALLLGTDYSFNSALGNDALLNSTTGSYNTAIGYEAMRSNTTGSYNTAAGYNALKSNISGQYNTAIAAFADVANPGLTNATAIGYRSVVNKSNSLILGAIAGQNGATESSKIAVNRYDMRDDAVVDLFGYLKGMLIPRMTNTQLNAIQNPAAGLMVYSTTSHTPWLFNGELWEDFDLPVGHLGAVEGQGIIYDGHSLTTGFCAGIQDADGDSKVDINFGSASSVAGDFRVLLKNNNTFNVTSNFPVFTHLRLDEDDLSTFLGEYAGLNQDVGSYNTGIGFGALKAINNGEKILHLEVVL